MINKKRAICSVLLVLLLCLSWPAQAAEQTAHSWYIKRNGKSTPTFPTDAEEISAYSAYYIDKKAAECGDKVLYLTFDVGYENGNVKKTLDILRAQDVPAAFFVLGNIIAKNSELVQKMITDGHLVCNHTMRHPDLSQASEKEIRDEIIKLEDIYRKYTDCDIDKFFRFPEGRYSKEAVQCVESLGYTTVFWSFGYEDWDNTKQPNPDYAIKKIIANTHCGAVILLHPTSSTNAAILGELITRWRDLGYRFGTLNELCVRSDAK